MSDNTTKLTVCGIMVAMSTVLSFIKFSELPYGGTVTLFSFVPVLFVGYAYGPKWGLSAGIVYGVLQALFGVSGATAGFAWFMNVATLAIWGPGVCCGRTGRLFCALLSV